ncbi:MAG: hypothetical protein V3U38_02960, partial [Gemmatimonadota bacterium]
MRSPSLSIERDDDDDGDEDGDWETGSSGQRIGLSAALDPYAPGACVDLESSPAVAQLEIDLVAAHSLQYRVRYVECDAAAPRL